MTRQDYIFHLEHLRKGVLALMAHDTKVRDLNGGLSQPTELEEKRGKKKGGDK